MTPNVDIDGLTHAVAEAETASLLGRTRCLQRFSRYKGDLHGTAKLALSTRHEVDCMACIAGEQAQ